MYSFQALKSILIENKVYFELCEKNETEGEITQVYIYLFIILNIIRIKITILNSTYIFL